MLNAQSSLFGQKCCLDIVETVLRSNIAFIYYHYYCYQDQEHTSHGEKLSEVAAKCWSLSSNQLIAIGVNCLHPSLVAPLLMSIHEELPRIPLIAYPNSGETYNAQLGQ